MKTLKLIVISTVLFIAFILEPISASYHNDAIGSPKSENPYFIQEGTASWYGPGFHGRRTASGEIFNTYDFTAAHKYLPFGTEVKVTNTDNGKYVIVKINDRGPYVGSRIIDLSYAAKQELEMGGLAHVTLEYYNPDLELSEEGESEVEGFEPKDLFEDVIQTKQNVLNHLYTFKKVNINLLTPNPDDVNSSLYKKIGSNEDINSSEVPEQITSGYTIKIIKTSGDYDTKQLIGNLESLKFGTIFVQVKPKKDSTFFYVLTGVYNSESDAKSDVKKLENEGYTVKVVKIGS